VEYYHASLFYARLCVLCAKNITQRTQSFQNKIRYSSEALLQYLDSGRILSYFNLLCKALRSLREKYHAEGAELSKQNKIFKRSPAATFGFRWNIIIL
jgi:hypothetical protein